MNVNISRTVLKQQRETLTILEFVKLYLHEIQEDYSDNNRLCFYSKSLVDSGMMEFQFSAQFKDPGRIKKLFEDYKFTTLAKEIEVNIQCLIPSCERLRR